MLSDDRQMKSKEFTKFILINLFNNIDNKKFLYLQNNWKQIFVMTLIKFVIFIVLVPQ